MFFIRKYLSCPRNLPLNEVMYYDNVQTTRKVWMQLLFYDIYLSLFAQLAIFTFNVYFHLTVIATLFFTFYQYMIKFYNNYNYYCILYVLCHLFLVMLSSQLCLSY